MIFHSSSPEVTSIPCCPLREITGFSAVTLQGLRAQMQAIEAHVLREEGGTWSETDRSVGALIDGILRLVPENAPLSPPCPVWAHAEDLADLDDELEMLASSPDHDRLTKGHYLAAGERHDALWLLVGASRLVSEKGALLALTSAAKISTEAADNELTPDELVEKIRAVRNLVAGAFFVLAERYPHSTLARLQTGWLPRYTYRLSTHAEVAAEEAARVAREGMVA
jgi:hypothetical protein